LDTYHTRAFITNEAHFFHFVKGFPHAHLKYYGHVK
jgi:hypothetical protein